ncbi:Peroxidase, family 2-domain-containing protein [Mycena olivaceomarginata]|nr:Peroxidase, family 2-domain-containing protein [Mycena olivaceomarginata]
MQLKFSSFVITSGLFFTAATAYPKNAEPKGHEFRAPGPGDVRGPCPGLNTNNVLICHNPCESWYLPRNGKQFTVKTLLDAGLGLCDSYFSNGKGTDSARSGIRPSAYYHRIDLDALSAHNIIEHDASISRNDFGNGIGDNTHFNETTFATLANSNPGKDYYDPVSAGEVQPARLAHSLGTNPFTVYTQKEFLLRSRESALYLSIFGDPATGIASKEFVNIFVREERLPYAEGFKLPKMPITDDSLSALEATIHNISQWTQTQKCGPLILGDGIAFNTDTFA